MNILFLIALFIRLSSAIYPPPPCPVPFLTNPPCAIRAPEVDEPICAVPDGWAGSPQTFGYIFQMAGFNCNCPYPYKYLHDGPCPDCSKPVACPRNYKPVCALPVGFCGPPKTFPNGCSLSSDNCSSVKKYKYFHDGECKVKDCPDGCFDLYAPVCALPDGFCGPPKTFGNSCYLKINNCKKDKKYKYFHDGDCLAVKKAAIKTVAAK